jgi:hypothetical protein
MAESPMAATAIGQRRLVAGLLFVGFLLLLPAILINAPGFGAQSPWGRAFPFLFDHVAQLYWSALFVVVTLYGLVILEGILRGAGDEIFSRVGLVSFTLAAALWLLLIVLDTNELPGGRDVERYFVLLAFPAIIAFGIALLRTRIVAPWVCIVVILWASVTLLRALPQSQGPLFYEPAILLVAGALVFPPRLKQKAQAGGEK